ncbi:MULTISPECIES: OsmC family protein [unclassified Bosea (in: a-proteobacteria)]|uniref:OsmC family protein n=1 Tax=unclassified Bosea (in: a-proteobacteria) TaxID=2653178 RepID=UPI000F7606B4|nr:MULTISPECIES: OsmC family protein [unclassified Bosea (in: a-proteobacteria)]AZO79476.1 peroxiredoxin [Bosea sp. Tri-49]RXT16285.1 peroxiredoxin [Bosea sp. Tri-39]RXT39978.1 peroxiredoxin [Bosea sp. Tri-54]
MATHGATITWQRGEEAFLDNRYSRAHLWRFDGGVEVPASSSPHVVRVPLSNPANVDPEEAYVAGLSSCHMLTFLNLAALRGLRVDSYVDAAEGVMLKNADGKKWVATVTLRPHIVFSGPKAPNEATVEVLHHEAHANCFLANSVRSAIETRGSWDYQGAA